MKSSTDTLESKPLLQEWGLILLCASPDCRYTAPLASAGSVCRVASELSAIGNNINQIAHWANARGDIRESEVTDAIALVRRAWELVKNGL